jgi:peroxiredoxin (alkyl hydroperoxide reductase subunit C)
LALVGRLAPSFALPAVFPDGETRQVRLGDYAGRWLCLVFYPHDFTFVCPTEILALSEAAPQFAAQQADLLAVSTDSPHVHRAWMAAPRDSGGLGPIAYPLASDVGHDVSRAYGVYCAAEGAAYRGLFLVGPDGVVAYEVVHNLNVGRSSDEVLRVLSALRAGGLCPVNWRPGEALLAAR